MAKNKFSVPIVYTAGILGLDDGGDGDETGRGSGVNPVGGNQPIVSDPVSYASWIGYFSSNSVMDLVTDGVVDRTDYEQWWFEKSMTDDRFTAEAFFELNNYYMDR